MVWLGLDKQWAVAHIVAPLVRPVRAWRFTHD